MSWTRAVISDDGTHHTIDGAAVYAARFLAVQKFHAPGLAPAIDASGAFHITPLGHPAYSNRFRQTWGFYEDLAAAEDAHGWCHIRPDGTPLTDRRFAWCGNFQEGRCAVRNLDGTYCHLTPEGTPAYPERYLYAGDFRDGAAVVRCPQRGLCTHITPDGRPLHGQWFIDLDVYHKGFARARDAGGWFHLDRRGHAAFTTRLASVEPFYNGTAIAESIDGRRLLIDQAGRAVLTLSPLPRVGAATSPSVAALIVGNIGSGKSTLAHSLAKQFDWPLLGIDSCRQQLGDGSAAGELRAWARFVAFAQATHPRVLEFSGSGPLTHLVRKALEDSRSTLAVLWVDTPVQLCLHRIEGRLWDIPHPDFGVPIDSVIRDLDARLHSEIGVKGKWGKSPVLRLDGQSPADSVHRRAVEHVVTQLRSTPT